MSGCLQDYLKQNTRKFSKAKPAHFGGVTAEDCLFHETNDRPEQSGQTHGYGASVQQAHITAGWSMTGHEATLQLYQCQCHRQRVGDTTKVAISLDQRFT